MQTSLLALPAAGSHESIGNGILESVMWSGISLRGRLTSVLVGVIGVLFVFGVLIFAVYERRNQRLLYNALYESIVVFSRSIERELDAVERFSVDVITDEGVQLSLRTLQPVSVKQVVT